MATLDDIMEHLQRAEREQKVRDAGILRAFDNLCSAINRQSQILNMIHEQGHEAKGSLTGLRDLLVVMPPAIGEAINNALDEREGILYEPGDAEDTAAGRDGHAG